MSESQDYPPYDLRTPQRVITDHDKDGKAVFSTKLDEVGPMVQMPKDVKFGLMYATKEFPVELSNDTDVNAYANYMKDLPGITIPGGTVARYVDAPPGSLSPMHRTISLDFGVVVEGEVELILDSGETRLLKRGDITVQRGTIHAWRNPSKTQWNRMLYFLQESKPIYVNGQLLGEDYGGDDDVLSVVKKST